MTKHRNITYAHGNLLDADVEALVNTVNTVGVMGKGVALQFKQAFPANYEEYRRACAKHEVQPGRIFVHHTQELGNPRFILNFPTKRHWKGKSRIEDIESGLEALVAIVRDLGIKSIAVPPLGCGNGGLLWHEVLPRIECAFDEVPDVELVVYGPEGAPAPDKMKVATKRPNVTPARAALLALIRNYAVPGYKMTMLEVQKLAYFLQAAGEPLRLPFTRGTYGPYAESIHHVLQRLEGHFIRGYGDRSTDVSIELTPDAPQAVEEALSNQAETTERLRRVSDLIDGFETPYGLELLATVYEVAQGEPCAKSDPEGAIEGVQAWSARKKKTFAPGHVRAAWNHLHRLGWI